MIAVVTVGTKMYDSLIASYGGDRELALKKFIQAYLGISRISR